MTAGFSPEGLGRVRSAMARFVDEGVMPGLIWLVARGSEPHVEAVGTPSFDDARPLRRDAIFRIASLTKPITAAATLILVDDGVVKLDHPAEHYLPELANRRVLRSPASPLDDTVPAVRAITVEDLLTFRLGFGSVMVPPGTYPIQDAEQDLHLMTLGPPWPPPSLTPDEWIRRFATLPLIAQPGERWLYNTGAQILGILIERVTGQPLLEFLRNRLFASLGMVDTDFFVPADKRDRFTTAYVLDAATGKPALLDNADDSYWKEPPAFPNAAGWLVSTIDDYWAFVRMIVRRGEHDGAQILRPQTVELMTTDHLSAAQRAQSALFLGADGGWGLGLRVPAAGTAQGPGGGFGWDGGTGTTWRTNRVADLSGMVFTQRALTSPEPPEYFVDFWTAVYGALDG
jgi:CubicO group peptidase (beta-lactamase class C family)